MQIIQIASTIQLRTPRIRILITYRFITTNPNKIKQIKSINHKRMVKMIMILSKIVLETQRVLMKINSTRKYSNKYKAIKQSFQSLIEYIISKRQCLNHYRLTKVLPSTTHKMTNYLCRPIYRSRRISMLCSQTRILFNKLVGQERLQISRITSGQFYL